jgi:esterase
MKLHYKKLGVGQPLVILHGLFGSSDNWQTLANKFAENFEVYLVDQRNHGHSPHSDEFSYQLMADDLFELIQIEMLSDILLVGHSMGGKTAMWFAQQHPSYIDKLVVVDMGIRAYPSHHERILAGMNAIDLKTTKSRGVADRVLAEYVPELATKMFLMKNLYWVERGQLGWRINLPVLEEKINEILGEVPDEVVDILTLFIRGAVHTVKDAGHWVHAEAPEEFYDVLIDFAE